MLYLVLWYMDNSLILSQTSCMMLYHHLHEFDCSSAVRDIDYGTGFCFCFHWQVGVLIVYCMVFVEHKSPLFGPTLPKVLLVSVQPFLFCCI